MFVPSVPVSIFPTSSQLRVRRRISLCGRNCCDGLPGRYRLPDSPPQQSQPGSSSLHLIGYRHLILNVFCPHSEGGVASSPTVEAMPITSHGAPGPLSQTINSFDNPDSEPVLGPRALVLHAHGQSQSSLDTIDQGEERQRE